MRMSYLPSQSLEMLEIGIIQGCLSRTLISRPADVHNHNQDRVTIAIGTDEL